MWRHARFTHFHSGGRAAGIAETIFSFSAPTPATEATPPKQIYADNTIPGEEAEVEILRHQRGFRLATVRRLLISSPNRVTPFCPHAEVCGGCNWQHITYPAQLYWKREILVNALVKYGIETPPVPEVIPSPLLQGFRNKSEYTFSADESPRFGFHPKENPTKVFACETCFLQPPHVHETAQKVFNLAQETAFPLYNHIHDPACQVVLRAMQIRTTTKDDAFCILGFYTNYTISHITEAIIRFLDRLQEAIPKISGWFYYITTPQEASRSFYPNFIHSIGVTHLEEVVHGKRFRYSPQSFFQPNPLQATAIYRYIFDHAQLTGTETVYDLYTGVGTIACTLAQHAKQVIGIEGNPSAIRDAQDNAALNNLHNVCFITGDILETFTPSFVDSHPKAHLIALDPPRSGTLIEIKKALLYASPQKIIYVSCNPVSLAWDLKQLCGSGGENRNSGRYRVAAIQPFDMFPHSHHVETVCILEKIIVDSQKK